jgi:hypothetical protein
MLLLSPQNRNSGLGNWRLLSFSRLFCIMRQVEGVWISCPKSQQVRRKARCPSPLFCALSSSLHLEILIFCSQIRDTKQQLPLLPSKLPKKLCYIISERTKTTYWEAEQQAFKVRPFVSMSMFTQPFHKRKSKFKKGPFKTTQNWKKTKVWVWRSVCCTTLLKSVTDAWHLYQMYRSPLRWNKSAHAGGEIYWLVLLGSNLVFMLPPSLGENHYLTSCWKNKARYLLKDNVRREGGVGFSFLFALPF